MGTVTANEEDREGRSSVPRRMTGRRVPLWIRISGVVGLAMVAIVVAAMALGAEGPGSGGGHGAGGGHGSGEEMRMGDDTPRGDHGDGGGEGRVEHGGGDSAASRDGHGSGEADSR